MPFAVWWIFFGVPLFAMGVSWVALCVRWRTDTQRALLALSMSFPTAATLLACGALAYIQSGRTVRGPLTVPVCGVLVALIGTALGFPVMLLFRRWFSGLAFGVSAWMLVLFGLMASSD